MSTTTKTRNANAKAKAKAGTIAAHHAAEAEARSLHAAAAEDAAVAASLIAQRTAEVDAAEAAVLAIEKAWEAGDSSHSAADLINAQAQVRKAEALLTAAAAAKREAHRRKASEDTRLAEIVAKAIESVSPFSAVATFVEPKLAVTDPEPACYVAQTKPAEYIGGGELAGSLTIVNVRDARWKELSAESVQRNLEDKGMSAKVQRVGRPSKAGEDIELDRYRVTVEAGHQEVPAIKADPNDYTAKGLGSQLVTRARNLAGSERLTIRERTRLAGVQRSGDERVSVVNVDVVFHSTSGPGSKSISAFEYASGGSALERRPVHKCINDAAQALTGTFARGLGIVTKVERKPAPDTVAARAHESKVRFVLTCHSQTYTD